jgi:hypothetical protein
MQSDVFLLFGDGATSANDSVTILHSYSPSLSNLVWEEGLAAREPQDAYFESRNGNRYAVVTEGEPGSSTSELYLLVERGAVPDGNSALHRTYFRFRLGIQLPTEDSTSAAIAAVAAGAPMPVVGIDMTNEYGQYSTRGVTVVRQTIHFVIEVASPAQPLVRDTDLAVLENLIDALTRVNLAIQVGRVQFSDAEEPNGSGGIELEVSYAELRATQANGNTSVSIATRESEISALLLPEHVIAIDGIDGVESAAVRIGRCTRHAEDTLAIRQTDFLDGRGEIQTRRTDVFYLDPELELVDDIRGLSLANWGYAKADDTHRSPLHAVIAGLVESAASSRDYCLQQVVAEGSEGTTWTYFDGQSEPGLVASFTERHLPGGHIGRTWTDAAGTVVGVQVWRDRASAVPERAWYATGDGSYVLWDPESGLRLAETKSWTSPHADGLLAMDIGAYSMLDRSSGGGGSSGLPKSISRVWSVARGRALADDAEISTSSYWVSLAATENSSERLGLVLQASRDWKAETELCFHYFSEQSRVRLWKPFALFSYEFSATNAGEATAPVVQTRLRWGRVYLPLSSEDELAIDAAVEEWQGVLTGQKKRQEKLKNLQ